MPGMSESLENIPITEDEILENEIPNLPNREYGDVRLTEREQRVMRCLQCLCDTETNEVIGVRQIDTCTKFSSYDRKYALDRLAKKGVIEKRSIDSSEKPKSDPTAKRAYRVVNGNKLAKGDINCPYKRDVHEPSQNPYLEATTIRRTILDCIRCLAAQGKPTTASYIKLCSGISESTVRRSLTLPILRGEIIQQRPNILAMINIQASRPLAYESSDASRPFLAPQKMPDCDIEQKEIEAVISHRTPTALGVLACISCQHSKIEAGQAKVISTKSINACYQNRPAAHVVRTFQKAGFLDDVEPKKRSRGRFVASEAGRLLFEATREKGLIPSQCNAYTAADESQQAINRARRETSNCVDCITNRQRQHGLDLGVTARMIADCLEISEGAAASILETLDLRRKNYRRPNNSLVFEPSVAALPRPRPSSCGYDFPTKVAGIDSKKISLSGVIGTRSRRQPVEVISTLGDIVQEGRDFNEVRLAVRALFASQIHFARSEAWRYSRFSDVPPQKDLEQAALIALVEAAESWHPSGVGAFGGYVGVVLRNQINQAILRYREQPKNVYWLINRISKAQASFLQEHERTATTDELIGILKDVAPASAVIRAIRANARRRALVDSQMRANDTHNTDNTQDDSPPKYSEKSYDEQRVNKVELADALGRTLHGLSEVDQYILQKLLQQDLSQQEIAKKTGMSQTHVYRKQRQLMTRLSHPSFATLAAMAPREYDWMDDAACHVKGETELASTWNQEIAKVCAGCPVTQKCEQLYQQIQNPARSGTWGGNPAWLLQ